MTTKRFCLTACCCLLAVAAMAKVQLPSVLQSNMVLQQQTEVRLWGKAEAGKKITVKTSWNHRKYQTTAQTDGSWQLMVATGTAGGPYEVTISDGDVTTLDNVLLGEVWLCSGQSNMEMPMRGFDRQPVEFGTNAEIARAKAKTPIRMYISDTDDNYQYIRQESQTPQFDMQGGWHQNTPEAVCRCSAVAYHFAQYLQDVLDVPVGVVVSTRGGSRIEPWLIGGELYNGKLHPLTPFTVSGFLWYQGESNCDNASEYAALMQQMVSQWRQVWGQGDLPFYFVEIAPFSYDNQPDGLKAAYLREAQQEAAKKIVNSGIVSTLDLGDATSIHPLRKKEVGTRLALMALGQTYGRKGFGYRSPTFRSLERIDGRLYVNMDNCGNGACPMWQSLGGFEIAGEDGIFHPAFAEVETKTCRLAVSSKDVPEPVAVRYCFKNTPEPSVYNIEGLPLLPFRAELKEIESSE